MLRLAKAPVGIGLVAVTVTTLQFHAVAARTVIFSQGVSSGEVATVPKGGFQRWPPFPSVGGPREMSRVEPQVSASTFSLDGKLLAAALSNVVRIWDTKAGTQVREIPVPVSGYCWIYSLAFSPDSTLLAAGLVGPYNPGGRILIVWKVDTGELINRFDREYSRSSGLLPLSYGAVIAIAYSPDGKYLAFGKSDGLGDKLKVLDVESGKVIRSFVGGPSGVSTLTFSPDGKLAAVYERILPFPRWGTVLWDLATGQKLHTYNGCSWVAGKTLAFSPDGRTLAAGDHSGRICLWDVRTAEKYPALRLGRAHVLAVAFSPDGKTLASAASDSTLHLWDVETGRELRRCTIDMHDFSQRSADFSPDAQMLATGGKDDRTVHLWDVETCAELHRFTM